MLAPTTAHIAIQTGIRVRYGEGCRDRQNSTREWMTSQNDGMVA
ncbi:MAG: hypothetical protein ACXVZH_02200 [Terriglobales bacterium]